MTTLRPEREVISDLARYAEHYGAESCRRDDGPSAAAGMRTILDYVQLRLQRDDQGELAEAARVVPTDVAAAYRSGYLTGGE